MIGEEAKFWQQIRDGVGGRWEPQRLEDKYSVGIPDLMYTTNVHGFIELKALPKGPLDSDKIFKIRHYTIEQRNWLRDHGKRAGFCFLFIRIGGNEYILLDWTVCHLVNTASLTHIRENATARWVGQMDWVDFLKRISVYVG